MVIGNIAAFLGYCVRSVVAMAYWMTSTPAVPAVAGVALLTWGVGQFWSPGHFIIPGVALLVEATLLMVESRPGRSRELPSVD